MRTLTVVCAAALLAGGCTITTGDLETNNRFAFPNSNVEPLGFVSAEESKTEFFIPDGPDREMRNRVLQAALDQKQGDIMIDYKWTTMTTVYPLFITTTKLRIDGTAARMDVGGQDVTAPNYTIPAPAPAPVATPAKPKKK